MVPGLCGISKHIILATIILLTPRSITLLKKLIVPQPVSRSPYFAEVESSVSPSQQPAACPYHEPHECTFSELSSKLYKVKSGMK